MVTMPHPNTVKQQYLTEELMKLLNLEKFINERKRETKQPQGELVLWLRPHRKQSDWLHPRSVIRSVVHVGGEIRGDEETPEGPSGRV